MIGYVEGTRVQTLPDSILLLTAGGVAYQVFVPAPLLAPPEVPGAIERFYTTTIIRDDQIGLFGFDQLRGKTLFETLLKVSGVGPKVAMALLSAFSPDEVATAVLSDNVGLLSSIPGIGKKTASRLCLELKDRLDKWQQAMSPALGQAAGPRQDLLSALTNLGFPEKDIVAALRQVTLGGGSFSEQLKSALAYLTRS
jgi:Holliday junction DNA helicase RuvA